MSDDNSALTVSVKLIFQPAEEGENGAQAMIDDGVLTDVDAIYGIHVWSPGNLGEVLVSHGPVMAAVDQFEITVNGSGGHGAMPNGTVDAIVSAANLVTNLQSVVSRNVPPTEAGVVTCGTIEGGANWNIIAPTVKLTGTTRSFTSETRSLIKERVKTICRCCGEMSGGSVDVKFDEGLPVTDNKYEHHVEVVKGVGSKMNCLIKKQLTMGGEDFSHYLNNKPGCFFFVGAKLPGDSKPHHKSR